MDVGVWVLKRKIFILWLVICFFTGLSSAVNLQVTLHISGAVSGDIVIELYPDKAPITVANFINYAKSGFYNGLIFHRVIDGFMIQGGGYNANLVKKTAGPAIINESFNHLSNLRGTIAMARTTYADTATSEFFINLVNNTFLNYDSIIYNYYTGQPHAQIGYCVFGEVVSEMNVVDSIAAVATDSNDVPVNDVIIQSASVTLDLPICQEKLEGDIDGDCDVDEADIMKFAIQWLNPKCVGCYSADFSKDGEVDFTDFAKMVSNWLDCNSATGCN